MASRFIQQFKKPDSASRSPVVITGAYIPEKLFFLKLTVLDVLKMIISSN